MTSNLIMDVQISKPYYKFVKPFLGTKAGYSNFIEGKSSMYSTRLYYKFSWNFAAIKIFFHTPAYEKFKNQIKRSDFFPDNIKLKTRQSSELFLCLFETYMLIIN